MAGVILIMILLLLLVAALPVWRMTRGWGYSASGLLGLILIIVIAFLVMDRL